MKNLLERIEGNFLLNIQKDKFHKDLNENIQGTKNSTLKNISFDEVEAHHPRKFKSTSTLPQKFEQTDTTNLGNARKTKRKNSQVSIVQDFLNYNQKQPNRIIQISKQRYTVNGSIFRKHEQQNPEKSNLSKDQQCTLERTRSIDENVVSSSAKYKHFKAFFQYVLEFKLKNVESYIPKIMQKVQIYINQPILSSQPRKSTKSLKVRFEPDEVQVQLNGSVQQSNKVQNNPKREIQQSQISIMNVQISDLSLQDDIQIPTIKSELYQFDQKSIKSMKKDKKVYFDFQNPNETSLDQIDSFDITEQNQNQSQTLYKSQSRIVSLQELRQRIQNAQQEANKYVHHGYFCDECKVDPIVGRRYKCIECEEYDLCQKCYHRQCKKFRNIMNNYQKDKKSLQKINLCHTPSEISPLMKKKMSDIQEEEAHSQLISSEEGIVISSDNYSHQDDHVHIMEEVNKSRPQFQQNLQKVLKQSNRFTNEILDKKSQKDSQKSQRDLSPLTPQFPRHRIFNKARIPFSKISFSQKTIPFKSNENHNIKSLESNKVKLENIKKQSMQIKNLIK